MKRINNLFLLTAFLLSILDCKADQLTITFTNPVPAAPVNCGDTWSEQGVNMEIPNYPFCNNYQFNYGNGNILVGPIGSTGTMRIDLTTFGIINNISFSIQFVRCLIFNYYSNGQIVYTEEECNSSGIFDNHTYNNPNYLPFDYLEIIANDGGGTLYDITIDFTPICETEPISNVRNGDVYLNNACYGVIMTSPNGNCFRAKVADNGSLFTEPVDCP